MPPTAFRKLPVFALTLTKNIGIHFEFFFGLKSWIQHVGWLVGWSHESARLTEQLESSFS